MREADLKALTLAELRSRKLIRHGDLVASEYVLGSSSRRADLAVMSRRFIGVEIKSEFDSLRRLNGQLAAYSTIFDTVLVVVAEKHSTLALKTAPTWAEVWKFSATGHCEVLRKGLTNQSTIHGRLSLLTSASLRRLAGCDQTASRTTLLKYASSLPSEAIDRELRLFFAQRYGATSAEFWANCKGRKIRSKHLELLSVYLPQRRTLADALRNEQAFWASWAKAAALPSSSTAIEPP